MIRIFAEWQDRVTLSKDDEHHLVHVLRVKPGEKIELLIQEMVYMGRVQSTKPLVIQRLERVVSHHELPFALTLIYPISKGDRFDWVIQKATELGTQSIIVCTSERSVVKWKTEDIEKKSLRYQRIIEEATLQSKREKMMTFKAIYPLKEALAFPFDLKFIASEYHLGSSFQLPPPLKIAKDQRVALLVGSEGGFSETEVASAIQAGFKPMSLGPSILRTETAVVTGLSLIRERGLENG
jgi:16S rRNA (uracil1498-N3)-methyltransferase